MKWARPRGQPCPDPNGAWSGQTWELANRRNPAPPAAPLAGKRCLFSAKECEWVEPKKLSWGTEEGNAFPLRQPNMKKLLHFLDLGAALAATIPAFAAESPWSLRVGATYLDTANHSSDFTALSTFFPANSITVEGK